MIVTNRTRCAFVPVYRLAYKGTLPGASRSGTVASALRQLQVIAEARKAFLTPWFSFDGAKRQPASRSVALLVTITDADSLGFTMVFASRMWTAKDLTSQIRIRDD